MPYKKRYSKRRRRYPYSRAHSAISIASKALTLAARTKKMLNVEYKLIDTSTTTAILSGGNIVGLNYIGQGDTNITRTGNQIKIVSILFKYFIGINPAATNTTVRIMLVIDKQTNAAQAAQSDLLEDSTGQGAIVSPIQIDNKFRFNIIYNRVHQMSISGKQNTYSNRYIKKELKIRYNGSGSTVASVTSNNLLLFMWSDESSNTPTIESHIRLRFVDN